MKINKTDAILLAAIIVTLTTDLNLTAFIVVEIIGSAFIAVCACTMDNARGSKLRFIEILPEDEQKKVIREANVTLAKDIQFIANIGMITTICAVIIQVAFFTF